MVSTIGGLALQTGSADGVGSNARFNRPWDVAVDAAGNLYVTDYANHTIRKGVPPWGPTPTLGIQLSANQVILSWPASATNFFLETSGQLSPAASWLPLTNPVAISGDNVVVTNLPAAAAAAFYRLRKR